MVTLVKLRWSGGLKFVAETEGRTVDLNSTVETGSVFTPMELFLVSLAGCASMDVVWILERQRQKIAELEVNIEGTRRDEDPKYYETINLEFVLSGTNIKKDAVERAIRLSKEKYCSVRAMLNSSIQVNTTFKIRKNTKSD